MLRHNRLTERLVSINVTSLVEGGSHPRRCSIAPVPADATESETRDISFPHDGQCDVQSRERALEENCFSIWWRHEILFLCNDFGVSDERAYLFPVERGMAERPRTVYFHLYDGRDDRVNTEKMASLAGHLLLA